VGATNPVRVSLEKVTEVVAWLRSAIRVGSPPPKTRPAAPAVPEVGRTVTAMP